MTSRYMARARGQQYTHPPLHAPLPDGSALCNWAEESAAWTARVSVALVAALLADPGAFLSGLDKSGPHFQRGHILAHMRGPCSGILRFLAT